MSSASPPTPVIQVDARRKVVAGSAVTDLSVVTLVAIIVLALSP